MYALGVFVQQGLLSRDFVHSIEKDLVELIRQLPDNHPNSQNIANTVHGLGMFAKQGYYRGISCMLLKKI